MELSVDYITPEVEVRHASLTVTDHRTGQEYQLPISAGGTLNAQLLKQITAGGDGVGLRVYDPGYTGTACAASSISYEGGEEGILAYRGYPIQELAGQCSYPEVAYLVIYGDLPNSSVLAAFQASVMRHAAVPIAVQDVIAAMPNGSHPMACIMAGLTALGACYPEQNPALAGMGCYKSLEVQDLQIARIIGKVSTLAALAYHKLCGTTFTPPNERLSFTENLLYMLDAHGDVSFRPDSRLVHVVEVLLVLHAEHEMNCSTAAVRHLASSGVDVYTAIAAGVAALHGPLHGGASGEVVNMLQAIGTPENVPEFLRQVKAKQQKLPGFGHRIYKNFDPRSQIMQQLALAVAGAAGADLLVQVALALQAAALSDDYFISRKLFPTVDFFDGLVHRAMGLPLEFNTVMFTVARVAGWCAHWRECLADPDTKIARPQQDYRGHWLRHYKPMAVRMQQQQHSLAASPASSYFSAIASGCSAAAAAAQIAEDRAAAAAAAAAVAADRADQSKGHHGHDGPVISRCSNAYMRRIAGENWM